jgi:hypothetical protein
VDQDLWLLYQLLKPKLEMSPLISQLTLFPLLMDKFSWKLNFSTKVSDQPSTSDCQVNNFIINHLLLTFNKYPSKYSLKSRICRLNQSHEISRRKTKVRARLIQRSRCFRLIRIWFGCCHLIIIEQRSLIDWSLEIKIIRPYGRRRISLHHLFWSQRVTYLFDLLILY